MTEKKNIQNIIYSKNAIELVAVTTESSSFFERTLDFKKNDFLDRTAKLLSFIYLKTSMSESLLPIYEEEPERFVTEQDYDFIRNGIINLLEGDDDYLEVFHPDFHLSDTPIIAHISENIADIYQEIKDFSLRYEIGNEEIMNDALYYCKASFKEHWGQKLLSTLRAIHFLLYNNPTDNIEEIRDTNQQTRISKEEFFNKIKNN